MSENIDSLSVEISSNADKAVSGIDALSTSLSKLKTATTGIKGLTTISSQLSALANSFNGLNSESSAKVGTLVDNLKRLNEISNIRVPVSIGTQVKKLVSSISEIDNRASSKLIGFTNNVSALSQLNDITISPSLATQLNKLNSVMSELSTFNFDTANSNITALVQALAQLNGVDKATGLNSTLNALSKLPEVANQLSSIDLSKFATDVQQLNDALAPLSNTLSKVSLSMSALPRTVKAVSRANNSVIQSNNGLNHSYISLYAKFKMVRFGLEAITNSLSYVIDKQNSYYETLNLVDVSLGQYSAKAKEYANSVYDAVGVNPVEFLQKEGVFNTILTGFGVVSDKAYTMSQQLTQVGYDLSSLYNISVTDAMQKVQSGISGELEPLRNLGFDLSVARLQQEAYNMGITKSVSNMTQAEKSQLRYHAILTQVSVAHGDLARTIQSPANQLRVLKSQFEITARAVGSIFIPALNAIIPVLNTILRAISTLASIIASFLGYKEPVSNLADSGIAVSGALDDASDSASDLGSGLGKAAKAAKELKNATLGIDELNVISPDDDSSSGSGSGASIGGGDLGLTPETYDFLGGITDKFTDVESMIKDHLAAVEATIGLFPLVIGTLLVITGANIPLGLGLMAVGAATIGAAIALNWDSINTDTAKALSGIMATLTGFFFALGVVMLCTGHAPMGIALMIAGAVNAGVTAAVIGNKLGFDIETVLNDLMLAVTGAFFGLGALMLFTGHVPLGIGLMLAGASSLGIALASNGSLSLPDGFESLINTLVSITTGGLLGLGAIALFLGNLPLGIALIVAGVGLTATSVATTGGGFDDFISSFKQVINIVSGASVAVGVMLIALGSAPLGIGLIVAGLTGIAAVNIDYKSLPNSIKNTLKSISGYVAASLVAIGLILTFTAAFTGLGIALIVAGGILGVTAVAMNWDSVKTDLDSALKSIGQLATVILIPLGIMMLFTPLVGMGIALLVAGGVAAGVGTYGLDFNGFLSDLGGACNKLKDKLDSARTSVKEFFTKGEDGENLFDHMKNGGKKLISKIGEGLEKAKPDFVKSAQANISAPVKAITDSDDFKKVVVKLKDTTSEWKSNVKNWWSNVKSSTSLNVSSFVGLCKDRWDSVTKWVSGFGLNATSTIDLLRNGWSSVTKWASDFGTDVQSWVGLARSGWTSVSEWVKQNIGGVVNIGVSLVKNWVGTAKSWLGLSTGGVVMNGSVHTWDSIPHYANGTSNAHGSLFVAGEAGAEAVGHINGRTEVLNKSQMATVMYDAVVAAFQQYLPAWNAINTQLATCANAVISANLVSADRVAVALDEQDSLNSANLTNMVYNTNRDEYERNVSDSTLYDALSSFYSERVEPTVKQMAQDMSTQANKSSETRVNVNGREILRAVEAQQKADGYKFTL